MSVSICAYYVANKTQSASVNRAMPHEMERTAMKTQPKLPVQNLYGNWMLGWYYSLLSSKSFRFDCGNFK